MKKNAVFLDVTTQPTHPSFLEMLKRHQLLAFFIIAFGISWAGWFLLLALQPSHLPAFAWNTNSLELALPAFLIFRITAYGPAIAAIVLTGLISGKQGLREFFKRFVLWRVGLQWYAVAIFSFAVIGLTIRALYILLIGPLPSNPFLTTWYSPLLWLVPLMLLGISLAALPEEPGWRGYALPRLLSRYNPLLASIILGLFWGLWHLPIFILDADKLLNFLLFLLQAMPLSILFTWVYLHTKRSILISILFHGAVDGVGALFLAGIPDVNSIQANLFEALVLWAAVLVVLVFFGPHLTRKSLSTGEKEHKMY